MELNVVVEIKVMPEGIEVEIEKINDKVKEIVNKYGKFHSSEIKPIAFGLKYLEVKILLNDKEGGLDEIEKEISAIKGVQSVEIVNFTLL